MTQQSLNDLIKTYRRDRLGFSQREMARYLACDYMWLSKLENGRVEPSDPQLNPVRQQFSLMAGIAIAQLEQMPVEQRERTEEAAFVCRVHE